MHTPICPSCQKERSRWLDTKPSEVLPKFGIVHGSGAPYDASASGSQDRGRADYERWRQLVRFQRDLIARTCREQRHADIPDRPVKSPRIIDLSLSCIESASDAPHTPIRVPEPKDVRDDSLYVHPAPEVTSVPVMPDSDQVCSSARGLVKYAEGLDWSVTITYARGSTLPWTLSGARCDSKLIESLALRMWRFPDQRAVMIYKDGKPDYGFIWRAGATFPQRIDKITQFKKSLVDRGATSIPGPPKDPKQAWDTMWSEVLTDRGEAA